MNSKKGVGIDHCNKVRKQDRICKNYALAMQQWLIYLIAG